VRDVEFSAGQLIAVLLEGDAFPGAAILDSCGVGHVGSHLLIAGTEPSEVLELKDKDVVETLATLDHLMSQDRAAIFTISYDFGARMLGLVRDVESSEPNVYVATFDSLLIHDYDTGRTSQIGALRDLPAPKSKGEDAWAKGLSSISSNFSRTEYGVAIDEIQELIRDGFTYQTNLTHQLTAALPEGLTPEAIFHNLRHAHPAPFAAFIRRHGSTVVSASPERFFRIDGDSISTSPIKGTRRRGETRDEDNALRQELLDSEKDRAENTMIVDLLRNDLGRVCEYGSVTVEKLCDLEEHPTLFHLVSTVNGKLRADVRFSDVLRALFPCGSITGAPKISTMKIIDRIERGSRGLSMGAIGYYIPKSMSEELAGFDLSVAIRTMVVRDKTAVFNVGGGIVIDSDPSSEWEETWTKASALLTAINAR